MLAYTYVSPGTFALQNKPKPVLLDDRDAIVKVTLSSICTSDLQSTATSPGLSPASPWATRWWGWWNRWAMPSARCARETG